MYQMTIIRQHQSIKILKRYWNIERVKIFNYRDTTKYRNWTFAILQYIEPAQHACMYIELQAQHTSIKTNADREIYGEEKDKERMRGEMRREGVRKGWGEWDIQSEREDVYYCMWERWRGRREIYKLRVSEILRESK